MAQDEGKEEEKFDFTREGEVLGYISLDQARVLAMRTARETPGEYGGQFVHTNMAFEVVEDTETEDHYVVTLSFRPQGEYAGTPGREQFFIAKEGNVVVRQVLSVPGGGRRFPIVPTAIGVLVVGIIAAVAAVFVLGGSGGNGTTVEAPAPTSAPMIIPPTPTETPPNLVSTANPTPTTMPAIPTNIPAPVATTTVLINTLVPTPSPGSTAVPRSTPDPKPTPTPVPATATPAPTSKPEPTPEPMSPPTPTPMATRRPTPTPTRTPIARPTPTFVSAGGLIRGATISGRVIDVDTGLPIANVRMRADDPTTRKGPRADTDLDGRYSLIGLSPGVYIVSADGLTIGYIREKYDDKYAWEDAARFAVTGTEVVEGIDFGLNRGATISGRVIDAVTGLPIAKMDVRAIPTAGDDLSWDETDLDGRFTLKGIPDGVVEVVVDGQGYIQTSRTVTVRDGQDVTNFDF